jgi:hypothetical protein
MVTELRHFYYLDSTGIHRLYNQLNEYNEKERRIKKQDNKSTSGKGNFISTISAGIFGLKGEGEKAHSQGSERITEKVLVKETEQELKKVEEYLDNQNSLLEVNNVKVLANIPVKRLPIFIRGSLPIIIPPPTSTSDIVKDVIKSQMVRFEIDQSALSEEYSIWPHILMGGSLCKFESARDAGDGTCTLGYTSHLAVILRGFQQGGGSFGVFGHVEKTGSNLYIKPYAIWR